MASVKRPLLILIVVLMLLPMNGCVYLRLLKLKGQFAEFDKYFMVREEGDLLITALEPVLLKQDILRLTGYPPSIEKTEKLSERWVYVFEKDYAPGCPAEDENYDMAFNMVFIDGMLYQFSLPERITGVLGGDFFLNTFRALGDAEVDKSERSARAKWRSGEKNDKPEEKTGSDHIDLAKKLWGEPSETGKEDSGRTCLYTFRFVPPDNPSRGPGMEKKLVFRLTIDDRIDKLTNFAWNTLSETAEPAAGELKIERSDIMPDKKGRTAYFDLSETIDGNISERMDDIIVFLSEALDVPVENETLAVTVHDGMNAVQDGTVYLQRSLFEEEKIAAGVFGKIFRHELTHYLTGKHWGPGPAFFDEGVAQYHGDDVWMKEELGYSSHEYCAILQENGFLIDLDKFVMGRHVLGKRHDFRISLENASFTGFLIEEFGIGKMRELFKVLKRPTPEHPVFEINRSLKKVYGKDLKELEGDWRNFLKNDIRPGRKAEEHFNKYRHMFEDYPGDVPVKYHHCKFCGTPGTEEGEICGRCGGDNGIEVRTD